MGFIADIGTVLRLTPDDDLQIVLGDGVYCNSDDRTPFNFQVQGHIYDGQLFYGLFGPVLRDCPVRGAWASTMVYEKPILPE